MLTKALTEKLLESQLFVGAVKRGHSLITEFAEGLREGAITGPPPGPSRDFEAIALTLCRSSRAGSETTRQHERPAAFARAMAGCSVARGTARLRATQTNARFFGPSLVAVARAVARSEATEGRAGGGGAV